MGLVLLFGELGLPLFYMGFVFVDFLADGSLIGGGLDGQEVDGYGEIVHADLLGLVLVPLIAGAGLHEHGFGVGAVADNGDHGDEDSEDGNSERDDFERFTTGLT